MTDALKGKKIVVIDDEPDFATFLDTLLQDNGAEVKTAYDGKSGLELVKSERPDLVTLDLNLPDQTGDKIYFEMRKDEDMRSIPVCIITGQPELRKLIYDTQVARPEGYINKPVKNEQVMMIVRKILKLSR